MFSLLMTRHSVDNIYLTDEQYRKIILMKSNYTARCKKRFLNRKYNHINKKNLFEFITDFEIIDFSDKLYEIKFKKWFSLYLYLHLKNLVGNNTFSISEPIEVNFTNIATKAGVARNTVKKAFWELVTFGLVIYDDLLPLSSNSVKKVMILNDKYLIGFNETEQKILYALSALRMENYEKS